MRVVDITSFFSEACGGIKTYYREKARWLPAAGITCHFVVPGKRAASEPFEAATLHRVPGPPMPGNRNYRLFGDLPRLRALVRELRPDVIELGSHYLLPSILEQPMPARLVGFYHADFPDTYVAPALRWAPRPVRDAALRAAWELVRRRHERYAATLVGSRHVAEKLARAGVGAVRWVGLGVDVDRFRPGAPLAPVPALAYVGRLSRDKGVPVLLAAVDTIFRRTGAHIWIIGDGPLATLSRRMARRRPWLHHVGFVGSAEGVARLIAGADAVIAPGAHESFSLAAAEAMACGVPVIGADCGGNAELVEDAGAGVLFPAGDPDALADAAGDLLRLPRSARDAMGRRGRAHVTGRLTWRHVFERIATTYREIA
jgi:alpha-1,6-mannosyltransferase